MMKLHSSAPEIDNLKEMLSKVSLRKRRTALWFFREEQKSRNSDTSPLCLSKITDHWRCMKPEEKRKYFNLAEMDKFRYERQRALWVAHLCSLTSGTKSKLHLSRDALDESNIESMEQLYRMFSNYENIIQAKSTQSIYKNVMKVPNAQNELEAIEGTSHVMSAVPEEFRQILEAPTRPPPSCVLFYREHKDRITKLRKEKYPESSFFKVASREWAKLSREKRAIYEDRYNDLLKQYLDNMEQFKAFIRRIGGSHLDQASKEKRAMKRALRMKLRDFTVVPRNVRNAFNFYAIFNKKTPLQNLTKSWRELPQDEKLFYERMSEDDRIRYRREKDVFNRVAEEVFESEKNMKAED